MVLPVIGAIAGGLIAAGGARSAANAQAGAARDANATQLEMFSQTTENLAPFVGAGRNYLDVLNFELLGGQAPMIGATPLQVTERRLDGRDRRTFGSDMAFDVGGQTFYNRDEADNFAQQNATGGTQYGGFTMSPDYQFRAEQGQDAVRAAQAASGNFFSGATMSALGDRQQQVAGLARDNYLNRLMGLTTMGQNAAAMQGTAAQNYANAYNQNAAAIGNAGAAGAIGGANAINNSIGNLTGLWAFQNAQGNNLFGNPIGSGFGFGGGSVGTFG